MADIMGLSLSIVQICGQVAGYAKGVYDAPESCRKIQAEMDIVATLMKSLLSKGAEREAEKWAECTKLLMAPEGPLTCLHGLLLEVDSKVKPARDPSPNLASGSGSSTNIARGDWLSRVKRKWKKPKSAAVISQSIFQRALWPLKEVEVYQLLATIERYKSWIQLALSNDTMELSRVIYGKVNTLESEVKKSNVLAQEIHEKVEVVGEDVKAVKKAQDLQKVERLLTWVTPLTFGKTQQDTFARMQNGTGQWFTEHDSYKDWRAGKWGTLFCPGDPGVGKSVIASMVINLLETSLATEDMGVGYLYCNYKEQAAQTLPNLLGSLLSQLALHPRIGATVVANIENLYEKHALQKTRPTVQEITKLLQGHVASVSHFYIVVDALDECSVGGQLITECKRLCAHGKVNILVTSRNIGYIRDWFRQDGEPLSIQAQDSDVERYLTEHLSILEESRPDLVLSTSVKEEIIKQILQKTDGMFLLAKLHMDSVSAKHSIRQMKETVESLPAGLDQTYEAAMARVLGQQADSSQLGKLVLTWITTAFRPLSVVELQHALATSSNPELTSLAQDGIIDPRRLVLVCCGLVRIEKASQRIRLVHYSTQEYFDKNHSIYFPEGHRALVATSLSYLSFDTFKECCTSGEELRQRVHANPLLKYAAVNWSEHAKASSKLGDNLRPLVSKFLARAGNTASNIQIIRTRDYSIRGTTVDTKIETFRSQAASPILGPTFFGCNEIVKQAVEEGVNVDFCDPQGRTALSIAAELGHQEVVEFLLKFRDVDPNLQDTEDSCTPLIYAAKAGHQEVVQLLLDNEVVDPNLADKNGWTPLRWAAANHHEPTTRILLQRHGLDPNRRDNKGITPLRWAILSSHYEIMRLLILHPEIDLDTSRSAMEDQKALWWWAVLHRERDASCTLTKRLNPASWEKDTFGDAMPTRIWDPPGGGTWKEDDPHHMRLKKIGGCWKNGGWHPIHLVSAADDIQTCAELLAVEGADPNVLTDICGKPCSEDCHLRRTYHHMVGSYQPHCVLVTPAHLAAQYGSVGVLQMLLGLPNINPNSRATETLETPLTIAVTYNMVEVVEVLLQNGKVDPNLEKSYETVHDKDSAYCSIAMTPLSISVYRGHETIARLLLADDRVDVNHRGGQALHAAIRGAKTTMVKLLLADPKIDPNIEGPHRDQETITKVLRSRHRYHAEPNDICAKSSEQQCYVYRCPYPLFQAIGTGVCDTFRRREPEILRALLDCPRIDIGVVGLIGRRQSNIDTTAPVQFPVEYRVTAVERILQISCDTDHCLENLKLALNRALTDDKGCIYTRPVAIESMESDVPQTLQPLATHAQTQSGNSSGSTLESLDRLLKFANQLQCRSPELVAKLLYLYPGIGHDHAWVKANASTLLSGLLSTWGVPRDTYINYQKAISTPIRIQKEVYKLLLNANASNNNSLDSKGRTITHLAVDTGNYILLDALIETGCDFTPNAGEGSECGTPLHIALRNMGCSGLSPNGGARAYIIYTLLELNGINPDLGDFTGRTPLSYAAGLGNHPIVEAMLEKLRKGSMNPDLGDFTGRTPLSYAASLAKGSRDTVKLLLERIDAVNPDSTDLTGRSPLSYAAEVGNTDAIKFLSERIDAINPDSRDLFGRTPLSYVAGSGDYEAVQTFLEGKFMVDTNSEDLVGRTPLSYAAEVGNSDIVKLFLERKDVDPVSKDIMGLTPLDWARFGGHSQVTQMLTKYQIYDPDSWMLED